LLVQPPSRSEFATPEEIETARVLSVNFLKTILTLRQNIPKDITEEGNLLYNGAEIVAPLASELNYPIVRKISVFD